MRFPILPASDYNTRAQIAFYLDQNFSNQVSWHMLTAYAVAFEGAGVSDPAIRSDVRNVSSVVRQSVGVYRITIPQTTIFGVPISTFVYPIVQVFAPSNTNEYVAAQYGGAISDGVFDFEVSEFYIAGQNLRVQPYDLQSGDFCTIIGLLNYDADDSDEVPAQIDTLFNLLTETNDNLTTETDVILTT